MTQPSGYPTEILLDGEQRLKYTCAICSPNLFRAPCQIQNCGHQFCEDCIIHLLREHDSVVCPTCLREDPSDTENITKDAYLPDFACRRAMSKLDVRCEHFQDGCTFQGKFQQLDEHLQTCVYVIVTCECGERMARKDLVLHRETSCTHAQANNRCKFGCADEDIPEEMPIEEHNEQAVVAHVSLLNRDVAKTKQKFGRAIQEITVKVQEYEAGGRQPPAESGATDLAGRSAPTATATSGEAGASASAGTIDATFVAESRRSMKNMEDKVKVTHNLFGVLFKEVQQAANRLLSLEKHMQKVMEEKEVQLREMRAAVNNVSASFNGTLLWEIEDVKRKSQEALSAGHASIVSPAFYTSRAGYKLCARIYLNGDGIGRGQYLSLFIVMMKGKYDSFQKWPFNQFVTFTLIDQSGQGQHVRDSFRTDPSSTSFRRPQSEMNIASGCPRFMNLSDLRSKWDNYVQNDNMLIEIKVDTQGLDNFGGQYF